MDSIPSQSGDAARLKDRPSQSGDPAPLKAITSQSGDAVFLDGLKAIRFRGADQITFQYYPRPNCRSDVRSFAGSGAHNDRNQKKVGVAVNPSRASMISSMAIFFALLAKANPTLRPRTLFHENLFLDETGVGRQVSNIDISLCLSTIGNL
jgi:hypothetical protein